MYFCLFSCSIFKILLFKAFLSDYPRRTSLFDLITWPYFIRFLFHILLSKFIQGTVNNRFIYQINEEKTIKIKEQERVKKSEK